ncbi:serine/threonine-protein kinase NIM1-like [Styela clava]
MTKAVKMQSPQNSKNLLTVPANVNHNSSETISSSASSPSSRSSSFSRRLTLDLTPTSTKKIESLNGYRLTKRETFPLMKSGSDNGESAEGQILSRTLLSPFEKLVQALNYDHRIKLELSYGKRIGFYSLKGDIGTGNFSRVKIGTHSLTKERVAVKILDKTKMDRKTKRLLSREISSMEKLHHPNIIRLYEVMHTKSKLFLVMEYAGGGELFSRLSSQGKMAESDAKIIFSQILSAVEHMHQHNIIHRDMKAENVFFSEKRIVKVGDFGFSTKAHGSKDALDTFCGSPPYAAPELFRDSYYYGEYVDIWALGILLYFAVTGTMPFRAETVGKLKKRILLGHFTVPSHVSSDCKHLIRNILKPSPSHRLSLQEIKQSSWFNRTSFPNATSFFNLDPRKVQRKEAQPEEAYALFMLERLGVKDDHMKRLSAVEESQDEPLFSWESDSESSPSNNDDSIGTSVDHSSAIVGTYRILLMRAHKKLVHPPSKEDLLKLSAITNHVTGRESPLTRHSKSCEHCGTSVDDNEISVPLVSANGISVQENNNIEKGINNDNDISSRSTGVHGQNTGTVKSKFCVIL